MSRADTPPPRHAVDERDGPSKRKSSDSATGSSPSEARAMRSSPWAAQTGHSISSTSLIVPETDAAALKSRLASSISRVMPQALVQAEPSGKAANAAVGHL